MYTSKASNNNSKSPHLWPQMFFLKNINAAISETLYYCPTLLELLWSQELWRITTLWSRCKFPAQQVESSIAEGRSSLASQEHLLEDAQSSAYTQNIPGKEIWNKQSKINSTADWGFCLPAVATAK